VSLPEIFDEVLEDGLTALGVAVDAAGRARLAAYVERLLFWNRKVNLAADAGAGEDAARHRER
jgi:16S rRNA G527 N7-methylase RsmG